MEQAQHTSKYAVFASLIFASLLIPTSGVHAAPLVQSLDSSVTMVASDITPTPEGIPNATICHDYIASGTGLVGSVEFYQNVDTLRFTLVTLYNITAGTASGGELNRFSWAFAPNNYVEGVGDGTGAMELYHISSEYLHNFYGGEARMQVNAGDTVRFCLGAYPKPQVFPKLYGNSTTLGDGTLPYLLISEDPPACTENCFSNVLFLPGIKGSILKSGSDTLWPSDAFGADIPQLALTEAGQSINTVVVDGILNTFSVGPFSAPVYSGFSSFMDSLVTDSTIHEWVPLAYDWRYAPDTILEDGIATPTGVVDVVQTVETLASTSKSGKVTIVAHSMGGLLGKALIKKLDDEGKAGLIDTFVMVGTPQLGTPQGIAALLHGDDEGIVDGIIVDASDVRSVGQNMESAYNLLPSPRYFDEVIDPVIVFSTTSAFTVPWRAQWGDEINTFAKYTEFITGLGVPRTDPAHTDLHTPEILRADIASSAANFHTLYDTYTPPASIRVVEIAGWGVPTLKAIQYQDVHNLGIPSTPVHGYKAVLTIEGDKTVVYKSAIPSDIGETYFLNLEEYRIDNKTRTQHKDLISIDITLSLLREILQSNIITENIYVTKTKPPVENNKDRLLVSVHSPVILGAHDSLGNFTGIDPSQDLTSEVFVITEDIPGSSFFTLGGDQYIFLPKEGSYTFVFKGIGTGPATVETATFSNDSLIPIASYTDIPVTESTEAVFVVNTAAPTETFIDVDTNGDGIIDTSVVPDGTVPPPTLEELVASLKIKIQSLATTPKLQEKLLKKVGKLEKKIAKNKKSSASKTLMSLGQKVVKKAEKGKISDADVEAILNLLGQIENAL